MIASEIVKQRNDRESKFTTSEIKSRIEAIFDARTHRVQTDRYDSRDYDEEEP